MPSSPENSCNFLQFIFMEKVLICSFKDTLQSIIKLRYLKLETIAKGTLVPEDLHFYVPLRFESCEQRQSALLWFPPCRGRRAPWERAWVGDRGGRSRARIREGAHDRAVSCPPHGLAEPRHLRSAVSWRSRMLSGAQLPSSSALRKVGCRGGRAAAASLS